MSGHTPWHEISAKVRSDPKKREKIERLKRVYLDHGQLATLGEQRADPQQVLAALLGISQARVSQIESGGDVNFSTLDWYINSLDGRREI